ncbi:MAG: shikimate dehydrogenase [Candidatus Nanopelagicales bacterium]|nr:shikimate dehydrogenase [Candidatus Nanopelagicales bacterium]
MKQAAVLGSPISHSLSPVLHRAAYRALGLDWHYAAIEVREEELGSFLATLDDSWAGLSLTMPLKEVAIGLCATVEPTAVRIRSVNTLIPQADGWHGTNTDIFGIVRSLASIGIGRGLESALVLGAGATARSAIAALASLEARNVLVSARRPEQAHELVALAAALGLAAEPAAWQPAAALLDCALVVSTLPGDAGGEWAKAAPAATGALLDSSYHPWPTPLAQQWPNGRIASGRDMLLWQATEQVRLMTGLEAPVDAMRASLPASSGAGADDTV